MERQNRRTAPISCSRLILTIVLCCINCDRVASDVAQFNDNNKHSRILVMPNPYVASHNRLYNKLLTQLVDRGHEVTVLRWAAVTTVEEIQPPKGVTVINYSTRQIPWVEKILDSLMWKTKDTYADYVHFMATGLPESMAQCYELNRQPELLADLRARNFTLGIIDPHAQPCAWSTMNYLSLPYISISPSVTVYYMEKAAATPTPLSYVPAINDGLQDQMTMQERLKNVFDQIFFSTSSYWSLIEWMIPRFHKIFADTDTRHRPLMVMFLAEKFIEFVRPETLTLQNIGLKDRIRTPVQDDLVQAAPQLSSNQIDESINNNPISDSPSVPSVVVANQASNFTSSFLYNNRTATVVLSLTTLGKTEQMSDEMKQAFSAAFSRFQNVRFIWRTLNSPVNGSHDPENDNVHFVRWFNQTNVFADTHTKLLITHGGIASVLEAVRHGIPILAMPMGIDHHGNIGRVVKHGVGLRIAKSELNADRLTEMVSEMLENPIYSARAHRISAMQDYEQECLLDDPLLWQTEYAARHGNKLLRIKAHGELMSTHKYFAIDIFTTVVITIAIVCSILA